MQNSSHNNFYTENLGEFGFREIKELSDLLNSWGNSGLPETFDNSGVRAAFNKNSGNVFLVNDDYQVAMMNGKELEVFHSLPYGGEEGFLMDLMNAHTPDDLHADDVEYIVEAYHNGQLTNSDDIPAVWMTIINV